MESSLQLEESQLLISSYNGKPPPVVKRVIHSSLFVGKASSSLVGDTDPSEGLGTVSARLGRCPTQVSHPSDDCYSQEFASTRLVSHFGVFC